MAAKLLFFSTLFRSLLVVFHHSNPAFPSDGLPTIPCGLFARCGIPSYKLISECEFASVPSINCSDAFHNGRIDPKYYRKTMKRSDQDIETSINTKEPRLEIEESATRSSLATQEGTERDNNSSKSALVKKALRRSLELKQDLKVRQAASQESSLKKITEGNERLREWSQVVNSGGFSNIFARCDLSCQICRPSLNLSWNKNQGWPFSFITTST